MEKRDKKLSLIINEVKNFYEQKCVLDSLNSEFLDTKIKFNKLMYTFFDDLSSDGKHLTLELDDPLNPCVIKITKVISTKVFWNIQKLKNILPIKYRKSVIKKKYNVVDWNGLFDFLKKEGVDFKKFKSFLSVEEYVLESSLDKLIELGYINADDIKDCSIVKANEPQYRIKEVT